MAAKVRLRWNGNNAAQEEADKAFAEWRAKSGSKKKQPKPGSKKKKRIRKKPYIDPNGRVNYRKYIDSKDWQSRKNRILAIRGKKCETCGSADRIQVHHLNYRNLGQEKDKDLRILCSGCHRNAHEGDKFGVVDPVTERYLAMQF